MNRPAPSTDQPWALAFVVVLVLGLAAGAALRLDQQTNAIRDLQARVARLDADHPTDERLEEMRRAAVTRAIDEGRRDLAGAERMVRR